MPNTSKLSTALSGIAGEYLVAAELSRRGYVASLTLRNTRGIDVLAANGDSTNSVSIQVKTNQTDHREWMLTKNSEDERADNFFYVFVRLNGLGSPSFHVAPSREVARYVRDSHQEWLSTPGKGGKPHKDNAIRKFRDLSNQYEGRWEVLGLDSTASLV